MGINNFNYHYYGNKIQPNYNAIPSFKGKDGDEDFKKKFDEIIKNRNDLLKDKAELEKIINPENISVFECLATQKQVNGYDRFTILNIKELIENANKDNAETFLFFLNMKKGNEYMFNAKDLRNIFNVLNEKNSATAQKLMQTRNDTTAYNLVDILSIPNIDEGLLLEFATKKKNDEYRFDMYDIAKIAPFLKSENKELMHSFLENNNEHNSCYELEEILSKCNDFQKQYVIELLKKRNNSSSSRFNIYEINSFISDINPENIEIVDKIINWKDEMGSYVFFHLDVSDLIKSGNLSEYGDVISQIVEKHIAKNKLRNLISNYVTRTFTAPSKYIKQGIDEIGKENFVKLPIEELEIATTNNFLHKLGIQNLKVLEENTPKEIWNNLNSISLFDYNKELKPEFVKERMSYLNNFPENIIKQMDAGVMKILLSDDFKPEDYQISQEAIKYFEGINPQILEKLTGSTILSLIIIPEEAHSIKQGLDFLCGLKPKTLEQFNPLVNHLLHIPGEMNNLGYNFNKKSAEEVLDILKDNLSPNLFEELEYENLAQTIISFDSTNDKETLLRNIAFLNKLVDDGVEPTTFSIGQILKAEKDIDLEKNKELVDKLMSYKNLEKLTKKYKGSELEKILNEIIGIKENDPRHFVFNLASKGRDISYLITQENIDEKSFTKNFEAFAQTVKMANRKLVKKNPETGELSFNFLNGNSYYSEEVAKKSLNSKFEKLFIDIINALSITDSGTINNLLNRRFNQFESQIETINNLPLEDKRILSMLVKDCGTLNANGKVVMISDRDKIDFITLIRANRRLITSGNTGINFNDYLKDITGHQVENKNIKKIIDIKSLKAEILKRALINSGIPEQDLSKISINNLKWDSDFTHLLFAKPPKDKGELATVIKESTLGNFQNFLTDETNEYGIANTNTENAFYEAGINFDVWDKKEAKDLKVTTKIGNENINIELWNRNPQESIFDGSYTTCCTALDAGNGASMARYLLNKAFNVVELKNDKGKTFAMSRIYMANIENKPSLIMENVEINNNWLENLSEKEKKQLKDSIVEYMKKFAGALSDKDVPIFFSTSYNKLENLWKKENNIVEKEIEFLGDISPKDIYMNTFKGYTKPVGQKTNAQFYEIK